MVLANIIADFAQEIRGLFHHSNFRLKDEHGEYRHPVVFEHALPPQKRGELPHVPWLLVTLYNGEQASADDPRLVTLHITCMTVDSTENMQGYLDAINMLERVCQHLYSKTIIADKYEVVYPYQFAVLDDVRYPYYSAGLAIKVQLQGTTPQNPIGGYSYV